MPNKNKGNKSNNEAIGDVVHVMMTFEVNHSIVNNNRVSAFFVMLRHGKQGGKWYFMKDRHVRSKKSKSLF